MIRHPKWFCTLQFKTKFQAMLFSRRTAALFCALSIFASGCFGAPFVVYKVAHPNRNLTGTRQAWGTVTKDGVYRLKQDVFFSLNKELDPVASGSESAPGIVHNILKEAYD